MGVTNKDYFQEDEYMSVSSFKKLLKCEVDGLEPHPASTAMLVGSYVDAYVEGTLDQFIEEHPEIVSSRGATKGELKSEFKKAEDICRYIDNDPILQQFLSGDKQTIMTGEIEGIPFKIKMDSYSEGIAINDLKIVRTVTNSQGQYIDFITQWGYDIQMACYQEIVRQNTGEQLPCYIVAITKEDPINSVVVHIPQEFLDRALGLVQVEIKRLYEVKMKQRDPIGCGVCSSCVQSRTETPIISLVEMI